MKEKVKQIIKKMKYLIYYTKCKIMKRRQYILFGTPLHGNLGDHAIALAEERILKDCKIKCFEVSTDEARYYYDLILKKISKNDVILITGGGSIGSEWIKEEQFIRKCIEDFKEQKIVVFPQTIFYKDNQQGEREKEEDIEVYKKARKLTIFVRETRTFELAKSIHKNANVILVPDIVLYLEKMERNLKRNGICLCIRQDAESKLSQDEKNQIKNIVSKYDSNIKYTDTVINEYVKPSKRRKKLREKIKELAKSKLVVTDRLHGMIFSRIAKTPCIAIGNYNYKVKGVYEWIKECPYIKYIDNVSELEDCVEKLYNYKETTCDFELKDEFNILKDILIG